MSKAPAGGAFLLVDYELRTNGTAHQATNYELGN